MAQEGHGPQGPHTRWAPHHRHQQRPHQVPEEAEVKGTRAGDNSQDIVEVYSRHGGTKRHHSNNGAAGNSKDRHRLQRHLANRGSKHVNNKSAENPEVIGIMEAHRWRLKEILQHSVRHYNEKSSGLEAEQPHKGTRAEDNIKAVCVVFSRIREDFRRHLKKTIHKAGVEREEPCLRHNNDLMQFRATAHGTRRNGTKAPNLRNNPAKVRKDKEGAKEDDKRLQVQTNTHGTYIGCDPMVKWAITQQEYAKRHELNTTLEAKNNHKKEEYGGHILQTGALLAVQLVTLTRVYYLLAGPKLAEALNFSTVVPLTGSARSTPKPPPQSLTSCIPSTRATTSPRTP